MTLESEIDLAARQVSTDAFSLTIGEVANMYRDGDIKINPDFQRLFRWDIERKSRLIESILVRIPLPPIFVFELNNSKWEVKAYPFDAGCSISGNAPQPGGAVN